MKFLKRLRLRGAFSFVPNNHKEVPPDGNPALLRVGRAGLGAVRACSEV